MSPEPFHPVPVESPKRALLPLPDSPTFPPWSPRQPPRELGSPANLDGTANARAAEGQ